MSFVIYKMERRDGTDYRWYLTDIPRDDNPLGGIGYRGSNDGSVPDTAGTAPTEEDAKKICEYLRTASHGQPEDHFYEPAP
ncbi:hypothetical protein H4C81_22460 [Pseudomonas monteilii]|uniref:hypothetical protein n=1 Tax=Pseudomonas monteilii TaxID=76759 RepID=UPI0015FCFC30|nr:hypothetical protein [Pseudomonas monteilii]MBA6091611.1 hypothetical protein [Pseudomonas monteilii]